MNDEGEVNVPGRFLCIIALVLLVGLFWFGWHLTHEKPQPAPIPTKTVAADDAGKFLVEKKEVEDTNAVPEWAAAIIGTNLDVQKTGVATNTVFSSRPKVAIHADLNKFRKQLEAQAEVPVK